jgi:Protein of unknown function (DUF2726)
MPPELTTLIDKPLLLMMILAIGAASGIAVERFVENQRKSERRAYWQGRKSVDGTKPSPWRKGRSVVPINGSAERAVPDAADQLRCVMEAQFKPRQLLNQPERRLLAVIDKALAEDTPGWRAMGQVSLGEILWSEDKEAYWAINSKRVDLLIVDADCHPLHAVEFQGTGHHQARNAAAARDAVKREALRRAGIGYVEVVSGDTPAEVKKLVRKLVAKA